MSGIVVAPFSCGSECGKSVCNLLIVDELAGETKRVLVCGAWDTSGSRQEFTSRNFRDRRQMQAKIDGARVSIRASPGYGLSCI